MARRGGRARRMEIGLFSGQQMTVVLPEVVSEALFTYGLFDELVTGMVLKAVRPGDVVLDIGAHFGYISLLCARLATERGAVYAFEPTPSTFEILSVNAQRMRNITPVRSAVGSRAGSVAIADYGLQYCAWNTLAPTSRMPAVLSSMQPEQTDVPVVRLDDWLREHGVEPTFIKIDAENFENEVIIGLRESLLRSKPTILMESGSEAALAAGSWLCDSGFAVLVSEEPGSIVEWSESIEAANARFKDLLFCTPERAKQLIGRS